MWNYDATTVALAAQIFPTELSLVPQSQWATYLRTNKDLLMGLLVFWAECQRTAQYRQKGLVSLPPARVQYSTVGNIQQLGSVDAVRMNYLLQSDAMTTNPTVALFRIASTVQAATTNYRTRYIGYS
jgi:hypothetical protein